MSFSTFSIHTLADAPSAGAPKLLRAKSGAPKTAKGGLNPLSLNSKVLLNQLDLNDDQRKRINELYALHDRSPGESSLVDHIFDDKDPVDQALAMDILENEKLDEAACADLGNRWSQTWSNKTGTVVKTRRVLYQCTSGYDHTRRSKKDAQNAARKVAMPFTGCLAHAELTIRAHKTPEERILRIRGQLQHSEDCQNARIENLPVFPLHPEVFDFALKQLKDGATIADVRRKNREMFAQKSYPSFPKNLKESCFRWIFTSNDSRSLHRKHHLQNGVALRDIPEIQIDDWLNPDSLAYNPTLAKAVFHYSARAERNERFEVCVATEEMDAAAWKHGHRKQIILDGTFGVCDKRLLLFIAMVVDEQKKGIPVAFLMFSAPTGNKQSSSGYDTEILTKLLTKWQDSLNRNKNKPSGATSFNPVSAITDTDLKERAALALVFLGIILLICRFHLRQSWRNHRNKVLKGKTAVLMDLKSRMRVLETALPKTEKIEDARQLIEDERGRLMLEATADPSSARAIQKAITHLDYLNGYWMTEALWKSWSNHNRLLVAGMLGCGIEGVIPTTNHLESFNGVLKKTHLKHWQNGGRRLRIDVLLNALVCFILPSIFEERRLYLEQSSRLSAMIALLPGGADLLNKKQMSSVEVVSERPKVAYLNPDSGRDSRASRLLEARQISVPEMMPGNMGLLFTCYSSQALSSEANPITYNIRAGFNGVVTCTCMDFVQEGGACKHIRAALLRAKEICLADGQPLPGIPIPKSVEDALALQKSQILTIRLRLPSTRAAEVVERLEQEGRAEDEADGATNAVDDHADEDDDASSVATDASSDSELDLSEDPIDERQMIQATQNTTALSAQATAKSLFQFDALVGGELSQWRKALGGITTGVSEAQTDMIRRGRAELLALADELSRIESLPRVAETDAQVFVRPATPPPPSSSAPLKRGSKRKASEMERTIYPVSPEAKQKRKQSYAYD
ncbi:unnamed protein product [Mycena citricolor]|uniref:SWIM-type domain-containing protein n=1 Tax=Mycena citricolor TaxID=2018698 RepID=A0AAD2GUU9_9AGAR|nr:unnamed protein product [Mycena citricolor]CAK5276301.1 unnamed protein product [Mycena citricolor]